MPNESKTPRERRLAANRAWKERNKAKMQAYAKQRNAIIMSDPVLKEKRRRQAVETRQRLRDKNRAYDKGRDKAKVHAGQAIRNRIYSGTLQRQPCEVCGQPNAHAHHKSYAPEARLDVRWLCPKHHIETHLNER